MKATQALTDAMESDRSGLTFYQDVVLLQGLSKDLLKNIARVLDMARAEQRNNPSDTIDLLVKELENL